MKLNLRTRHFLPLMLCLIVLASAKADMLLQVTIPTTNLTSNVGPFTVFFQMFRDGTNVLESPRNLVTISDFTFGGGHADSGGLTNYGGGSGNMAAPTGQVQLADSAIVNVHSQRFQPGSQFQFRALLSSVRSFNGPASFSFYLLGTNGLPIPTTSSLDEFLRIDLDDLQPALKLFRSDLSNTTFDIPQPTVHLTNKSKLPQFTLKVTTNPGTNGNLRLDFPEAKFADLFELEASVDLRTWTNLGPRAYVGEPLIFSDPERTNFPIRFYRASMPNAPQPIQSTPLITLQPASRTNLVGTAAAFSVVASGVSPLSFRWRHNGTDLLGQTNASLSLLNVQIADQGGYDAVVSNPYGALTSSVATLTVVIPPPEPAMDFTAHSLPSTDASYSMGFEFDTLQPITVTSLGMFDDGTNGFAQGHDVGIFNSNGTLLASTTVFSTNQLIGYFRYQQIPPLNLPAASGYRIAAVTGDEGFIWSPSGTTTNALIRFVRNRWTPYMTNLVFPTSSDSDGRVGYFGPNLLLTEMFNPGITSQPKSRTNVVGTTATFVVGAAGRQPLAYQWRKGGLNLNGQNDTALSLTNVSLATAGNYDVVVSNAFGSVTSQVATLTVTTNSLMVDLLAYFPFEGDAFDASGNERDGIVQGAVLTTNRSGSAGSAYMFNGGNSIRVDNLDPDIYTNGFSFGAWVRPDAYSGVLGWTYDAGWGATYLAAGGSTVTFRVGTGSSDTDHGVSASVPLGGWSHLFVTHHPTNDALYLNGVQVGQWRSYPMQGNVPTFLIGSSYAGNFVGAIDEVAVFEREVSSNEVAVIYAGGLGGLISGRSPKIISHPSNAIRGFGSSALFSVVVSGTAPLGYRWRHEGTNLLDSSEVSGTATATLVLSNLQQAAVGNYDVRVTNNYGSVTSSLASLSLQTGVIPEALLLYLPFDGDALDASGNARDGIVAGAVLTTNRLGGPNSAYAFNGSSIITVTNLDPDNYTNGFSFGGWVRSDSGAGAPVYWVHDIGWGSTYIILSAPGGISFRLGSGSPSTAYSVNGLNLGLGQWHHLFVTHDTNWNRFFVNGLKVFESASLPLLGNVSTLEMGRDGFIGSVDEFMVFGRGVTADEVSLIYGLGLNLIPKATFASPTVTASSVVLPINGTVGSRWGMERAISISGPWTNIGSVLLDGTGIGFFQDTNPPSGAAYYRARK